MEKIKPGQCELSFNNIDFCIYTFENGVYKNNDKINNLASGTDNYIDLPCNAHHLHPTVLI